MALSRYSFTRKIPGGVSTSNASYKRLDQLSGESYGDAGYWWVIAAASGIGWGMQVPPGTLIKIPDSLEKVIGLLI